MSLYKETKSNNLPIARLYKPSSDYWSHIGERVEQLDKVCVLPEHVFPDGELKKWFLDGDNSIVLLFENEMLIGYAVARPVSKIWSDTRFQDSDTCNLSTIVIDPEFQGNGYVKFIMDLMEEVLQKRDYNF